MSQEHRAFTLRANGLLREIRMNVVLLKVDPTITEIPADTPMFSAIWDTGATNTAISSAVASKLGLTPIGYTENPVGTGGGQVENAPLHLLQVIFPADNPSRVGIAVQVTELAGLGPDVLIGMDIISQGDFALTHVDGKTCMSFRLPSSNVIDFIPDADAHNARVLGVAKPNWLAPKRKKQHKKHR